MGCRADGTVILVRCPAVGPTRSPTWMPHLCFFMGDGCFVSMLASHASLDVVRALAEQIVF